MTFLCFIVPLILLWLGWKDRCTFQVPSYLCPKAAKRNSRGPASLKQETILCSLRLPEARSQKSRWERDQTPSKGYWGESFASSSFRWLQAFLGQWLHHSKLCFYLRMAFSSSLLSLKGTLVIGCRVYLGNPEWSHLKVLNFICKDSFSKEGHSHIL